MPAMQHAIVLAPRSHRYTRAEFQRHYEEFHAPLFYSFGKVGVGRYVRNHIVRAIGDDPPFDTISEFWNYPDKRTELIAALRAPEAKALEEDVHSVLAERGNVFAVDEQIISGPPRGFEPGPAKKRMILLKRPDGVSADDFAMVARRYADTAGLGALRVALTLWQSEPAPPMDAMVTIWPAEDAALPDAITKLPDVEIPYALDVESYCTAWEK
jgi:uncharacterized protein (TIGR02118 family)